ncbi:MAG: hypothetical protein ACRDPX_14575 [Gaiellaceae bacterium]
MTLRFLIPIAVIGSMLAMVTPTASAARQARLDIPACEELLTVPEAKNAMGEPIANILQREVRDDTRVCAYWGGSKGAKAIGHSIGVNWGPFADFRKRAGGLAKKSICAASQKACDRIADAVSLRRDRASFAALADGLDHVGVVRPLPAAAFKGSPAFLWKPGSGLAEGLAEAAWVFVYDAKSAHMLQVLCTDADAGAPDTACAIAAAKRAFGNITS